MISLENNPTLKKDGELEAELDKAYVERGSLFKKYIPITFPPLTEKQAYDLATTIYD